MQEIDKGQLLKEAIGAWVHRLYGGSTSRPFIVTIYSERGGAGAVKAPKKKRLTGPIKTESRKRHKQLVCYSV